MGLISRVSSRTYRKKPEELFVSPKKWDSPNKKSPPTELNSPPSKKTADRRLAPLGERRRSLRKTAALAITRTSHKHLKNLMPTKFQASRKSTCLPMMVM